MRCPSDGRGRRPQSLHRLCHRAARAGRLVLLRPGRTGHREHRRAGDARHRAAGPVGASDGDDAGRSADRGLSDGAAGRGAGASGGHAARRAELRDTQGWDREVQALAAQGWWVLRPNFRGSGGYGLGFASQGWTRWGDRMQEDVEDAVALAIESKGLDATRVAIIGSSYGGYAALMGAVRRPDLYKAAIGICGVYDLPDMLAWEEREDDQPGKPVYDFWVRRIGDPRTVGPALQAASPRRRVAEVSCPVLLVHGVDDKVVPIVQSRRMNDALRAAGKSVELVEVADAGHADWTASEGEVLMRRYVALLRTAFA
ncbi:alpha/beta hydrolase family protein [Brevundimonas sp. GCM10030266]|uniref:alpha/beta hydrolase family protein n=1 Tax=Brevundimonas sp. GCM10030266 TaxID=3273386 RepID=UPI00361C49A5